MNNSSLFRARDAWRIALTIVGCFAAMGAGMQLAVDTLSEWWILLLVAGFCTLIVSIYRDCEEW